MTKSDKKNAVVIFSKAPIAGEVKTRLAKDLGQQRALEVYKAMLRVICKTVSSDADWDCYLSASKYLDHPFFLDLVSDYDLNTHLQEEGDLGWKMQSAMEELLCKYDKVCIVGGDAISINSELLKKSFGALDANDVSLVPAEDGGYIAIAVKHTDSDMFTDIQWGTEQVLEQQLGCFSSIGWDAWLSSPHWDLDEISDFERVKSMSVLHQSLIEAGLDKTI